MKKKKVAYDAVETEPVKLQLKKDNLKDFKQILLSFVHDSYDEIEIYYLIHYLSPEDRIWLINKVYQLLKIDGKVTLKLPYWVSSRYYGDLSVHPHPVTESWFPYLNLQWRKENNESNDIYSCNFDFTWGYGLHPLIASRNLEYQQHALIFWKESAQDLIATGVKK